MGYDLPDGTKKITISYSGGFVGLEEHSFRQYWEGIVPWYMLGNIFLKEGWYDGDDNWTSSTNGAGSSAALTSDYYSSMGVCYKLVSANGAGWYARVYRHLPHLGDKKYGFGCEIALGSAGGGPT